jgi:hypothetical protein
VILCISSASGSARFGYIYLAAHELAKKEAITANFDNAGRLVECFLCPNFDEFMATSKLINWDITFLTGLPLYILRTGMHIFQA